MKLAPRLLGATLVLALAAPALGKPTVEEILGVEPFVDDREKKIEIIVGGGVAVAQLDEADERELAVGLACLTKKPVAEVLAPFGPKTRQAEARSAEAKPAEARPGGPAGRLVDSAFRGNFDQGGPTRENRRRIRDMANERDIQDEPVVSRRAVLAGAGALAAVAASGVASAADHHDHAAHAPKRPKLLASLEACTSTGRLCVSHCLVTFREGDSSLAECAARVHEMMAVCAAMETLVAANSPYVKAMAKVCAEACEDCSAECKKHAEKHRECRDCMEACDALLPELKKLA